MKKFLIPLIAMCMLASCGGNTVSADSDKESSADSVTSTEKAITVDTVAILTEADSVIRQSLTAYYDSQKKQNHLDKLSDDIFTPEFTKAFSEAHAKYEKEGKAKQPSMSGLLPGVVTIPYDILYDNPTEGSLDGMETPKRGKFEITGIDFDGLDRASVKVKATTIWNFYIPEEDNTVTEYRTATVTVIFLKDENGHWLIDDFEHKKLGSFRKNIDNGKAFRVEWYT